MDLFGLGVVLACGLCACLAAAVAFTLRTLTRPPRRGYAYALARNLPADPGAVPRPGSTTPRAFEEWAFTSRALVLKAWDVAGDDPAGPTVIVSHGWGDARVVMLDRLPALAAASGRVVLWDLPGHGDSAGRCTLGTEEHTDLLALIDRVGDERGVVLYGFSLGAGLSIVAAALDPRVGAVIAEAPYRFAVTPARRVLRLAALPSRGVLPVALSILGLRWRLGRKWWAERDGNRFDRARWAASLQVPLLVLSGRQDAVCPTQDAAAIARAAPLGHAVEIAGAGHTDLWTHPHHAAPATAALHGLLGSLSPARPGPTGPPRI